MKPAINGYLAQPKNSKDLGEKILKAFDMKVKKIPSDVCSWKSVAKKFEQLYENVFAARV